MHISYVYFFCYPWTYNIIAPNGPFITMDGVETLQTEVGDTVLE